MSFKIPLYSSSSVSKDYNFVTMISALLIQSYGDFKIINATFYAKIPDCIHFLYRTSMIQKKLISDLFSITARKNKVARECSIKFEKKISISI